MNSSDAETVQRLFEEQGSGREIRARFQKACAIAHGRGAKMSANEMMELVLEHGLPPRVERERILREKLAADDGGTASGTASPSSPPQSV